MVSVSNSRLPADGFPGAQTEEAAWPWAGIHADRAGFSSCGTALGRDRRLPRHLPRLGVKKTASCCIPNNAVSEGYPHALPQFHR